MINIVKEIKINILNSVKFLMRVYKRSAMFAFTLAMFIVIAFFPDEFNHITGVRYILLECSAVMFLTTSILYIFDFVNAIKNCLKQRASKEKIQSNTLNVTVGIPKKR